MGGGGRGARAPGYGEEPGGGVKKLGALKGGAGRKAQRPKEKSGGKRGKKPPNNFDSTNIPNDRMIPKEKVGVRGIFPPNNARRKRGGLENGRPGKKGFSPGKTGRGDPACEPQRQWDFPRREKGFWGFSPKTKRNFLKNLFLI